VHQCALNASNRFHYKLIISFQFPFSRVFRTSLLRVRWAVAIARTHTAKILMVSSLLDGQSVYMRVPVCVCNNAMSVEGKESSSGCSYYDRTIARAVHLE